MLLQGMKSALSKGGVAVATALSIVMAAATAFAAEVQGTVQTVDPQSGTLVLEDGSTFTIGEELAIDNLAPGDQIVVSYEEQGGQMVVNDITKAQ